MTLAMGPFGYPIDYAGMWLVYFSLLVHTWCFFRFFPAKARPRGRLILGNVLVFSCLIGLVGLGGETYFRFIAVGTDPFGITLPAQRWFKRNTSLNSLGFRDIEWRREKPTGIRRIAFVGDSICYGWGIENVQDRYTGILQRQFDQRHPGQIEVMNSAVPGSDTGDHIRYLSTMIRDYAADEIVLCYVFNDIERVLPRSKEFDPTRPPDPWLFDSESSCLLHYLYMTLYLPRVPTVRKNHEWLAEGYTTASSWRAHQTDLETIISTCRDAGVTLRVVLQPFLCMDEKQFDRGRLHRAMRAYFELAGVPVLDLLPVVADIDERELVVTRRDTHPNEQAHALFAEAIWDAFFGGNDG